MHNKHFSQVYVHHTTTFHFSFINVHVNLYDVWRNSGKPHNGPEKTVSCFVFKSLELRRELGLLTSVVYGYDVENIDGNK